MSYFALSSASWGAVLNDNPEIAKKQKIINHVCGSFKLSYEKITSKSRKVEIVLVRQFLAYLLRCYTVLSDAEIGELIKRDRSTAIYSYEIILDIINQKHVSKEKVRLVNFLKRFGYDAERKIGLDRLHDKKG